MMEMIIGINNIILIYFAILGIGYTILLIASFPDILRKFREAEYGNISDLISGDELLPITIIVPAYNEEHRVLNAVYSILNSDYKNVRIVVSCDGPTDNTVQKLVKTFDMYEVPPVIQRKIKTAKIRHYYESTTYPNVTVIDKEHSNTGDTINAGLNACQTPLFMTVDADTILEPSALTRLFFTYLANAHCIVVGGAVYVLNGNEVREGRFMRDRRIPNSYVPAIQCTEYLRSFLFGRSGWNMFGGALSYAGAFSFFETHAVLEVGGFDVDNFAQDAEIIVKLHRYMREQHYPYAITFTPNAFAWTEVPGSLLAFWRQRNHWQRGLMRSFFLHKKLFLFYRYGILGYFSYPFYVAFEIFGPIVELTAYITMFLGLFYGFVPGSVVLLFIALAWGYLAFLTMATVFLSLITFNTYHRKLDILRMFGLVLLELIGFRQFNVVCRVVAIFQYGFNRLLGRSV